MLVLSVSVRSANGLTLPSIGVSRRNRKFLAMLAIEALTIMGTIDSVCGAFVRARVSRPPNQHLQHAGKAPYFIDQHCMADTTCVRMQPMLYNTLSDQQINTLRVTIASIVSA